MSAAIYLLIGFALGGALCFVIGWLIGSRRGGTVAPVDNRLEGELRQQLTQRETELAQQREQLSQANTARATAEAQRAAAEKMQSEQRQSHEQNLREAKLAQEKAITDLREAFKALSADALKQSASGVFAVGGAKFRKTSGGG